MKNKKVNEEVEVREIGAITKIDFLTKLRNFLLKAFRRKIKKRDFVDILPVNVSEKIFNYCSGKDLLNFSLVNRKWYKLIAKSPSCMDKLKIVLVETRSTCFQYLSMHDAFILTINGRNYVHISLSSMEYQLLAQHKILLATFQWKTVALTNQTFKTKIDFINFLGAIEPFVEDLTLRAIRIEKTIDEISASNFTFPKLLRLTILNCYTYVYSDPFKFVKTLRYFNVATEAIPHYVMDENEELVERVRAIQMILLTNELISHLKLFINQKDFDSMFMDQRFLNRLSFRLYALYVGKFRQQDDVNINTVQINNFVELLKSQKDSLRILYLENWLGNAALEYAINEMILRELTIENCDYFNRHNESISDLSLFSNDTIQNVAIWSKAARHHFIPNEILKVCRDLRFLEIRTINQEILKTIIEYNDDIEVIVCDFFTAYQPPEKQVMKKLKYMDININCADNFRDLIRYKNCYTNFETVFLRAAQELKNRCDLETMNFNRYNN